MPDAEHNLLLTLARNARHGGPPLGDGSGDVHLLEKALEPFGDEGLPAAPAPAAAPPKRARKPAGAAPELAAGEAAPGTAAN